MLKIIVSGCNGHMEQSVVNLCSGMDDVEIPCGFNRTPLEKNGFPVYSVPGDYAGEADVVIDFSNPANLTALSFPPPRSPRAAARSNRWCTARRVSDG